MKIFKNINTFKGSTSILHLALISLASACAFNPYGTFTEKTVDARFLARVAEEKYSPETTEDLFCYGKLRDAIRTCYINDETSSPCSIETGLAQCRSAIADAFSNSECQNFIPKDYYVAAMAGIFYDNITERLIDECGVLQNIPGCQAVHTTLQRLNDQDASCEVKEHLTRSQDLCINSIAGRNGLSLTPTSVISIAYDTFKKGQKAEKELNNYCHTK